MKRGHEETSVAETSGPKKTKTVSNEEWTKVEKKKQKKIRKAEAKMDVNTHPRFMYSNTEIVKRHHPITIDVSFFLLFESFSCQHDNADVFLV